MEAYELKIDKNKQDNLIFRKKEKYEKIIPKVLSDFSIDVLDKILSIDENTDLASIDLSKIINQKHGEKRVWALFGICKDKNEGICLQVAESKNIVKEINRNIELMFEQEKNKYIHAKAEKTYRDTQFYKNTYYIYNGKKKRECIYNKMRSDYIELIFYELNIDKYLDLNGFIDQNPNINEIIQVSKSYFAETKFAYETQSIYWNSYRSGIGVECLKNLIKRSNK